MPRDESLAAITHAGRTTATLSTTTDKQVIPALESSSDDGLLTVHDAARFLNVPVSWVYEHTRKNCIDPLPFVKLGKYLRFDGADLRTYIDTRRAATTAARRKR
jgi:excisionase family DNA binding protein